MRQCLIFLICLPLLGLTLAKKVEIDNLYRAILKDQEGIEHKNLLIDLLIDNVLGLCYVSCPGGASLVPRPDPIVDINGCGSYNIHIDFELFNAGEFNQCCNGHDVCYESCDSTKNKCDTTFERCLKDVCNTWAAEQNWGLIQKTACSGVVKAMNEAVENFGCNAYKKAQLRGCKCP
ncbi:group XIIA secretory phospholipase A2 [Brachionus plicatilis]|uniref:Group XIIA secretory phospholipase A2 n=1 Tax=Brachionus plicatilis TaxID=10195 RepID=A0A3M7PGB5_BRAPC|nr:group XIIA secretory phospholipase A2 [Brachionus plicatilis]